MNGVGKGLGELVIYQPPLTADKMKSIYKTGLWKSALAMYGEHGDWWLLYDNDPRHKAQVTIQWLNDNLVRRRIDFPPYSPDLNVIENLWPIFLQFIDRHPQQTQSQLEEAVVSAWNEMRKDERVKEICKRLARSMPSRLTEVIENKGHKTHY